MSGLLTLLFLILICFAPLLATTFVARRMGYRGWALGAPWAAVAVLLILLIGGLWWLIGPGDGRVGAIRGMMIGGVVLSGYLLNLIHLIVLAARSLPVRPSDAAAVF